MNYWQGTGLAIIEGLTEYLPISSTAHLMWGSNLFGVQPSEFAKTFEIAVQLGAILAIVSLYARKVWKRKELLKRVIIAFLPTGIVGLVGYKLVKGYLLESPLVAIGAMFGGGVFILIWEKYFNKNNSRGKIQDLPYLKCVGIGLCQAAALVPGVSRAAATIFGGMGMGLSREEAVEMSFLLAVPTIAAAAGWDMVKSMGSIKWDEWGILVGGGVVSWLVAMGVVKWLVGFVKRNDMKIFGWYRVIAAVGWIFTYLWLRG